MHRSARHLYRSFRSRHSPRASGEGLRQLGAFPPERPLCIVARSEETGELFVMLRGRRFAEENALVTSWRQAEIQIGDRSFRGAPPRRKLKD